MNQTTNGAALAAFLAAGLGTLALGLSVLLAEAGVYSAPVLYAPSGGVTGRTAIGVVLWLIAWAVLHARWKHRQMEPRRIHVATVVSIVLGLIFLLPPVWSLFG